LTVGALCFGCVPCYDGRGDKLALAGNGIGVVDHVKLHKAADLEPGIEPLHSEGPPWGDASRWCCLGFFSDGSLWRRGAFGQSLHLLPEFLKLFLLRFQLLLLGIQLSLLPLDDPLQLLHLGGIPRLDWMRGPLYLLILGKRRHPQAKYRRCGKAEQGEPPSHSDLLVFILLIARPSRRKTCRVIFVQVSCHH